ncbi:MAG: hypothetical protein WC690_07765, partial [bacterium]
MVLWERVRSITAIAALSCACLIAACGGGSGGGGAGSNGLAAPTGVSASAGDAQVVLNWNAVDGATGYAVFTANSAGIAASISKSTDTPTEIDVTDAPYTHTGLTNGTAYYYVVAAVNADGVGALSDEVTTTPLLGLPAAPTGLAITVGNKSVALNWDAVSGATSYKLYWNTTAGIDTSTPNTQTSTANNFAHANISNLNTYYYRVAAVNSTGEGTLSEEKSATPAFGGSELLSIKDAPATFDDEYGYAVAIDGDTAIVGAPHYFNLNPNKMGSAFIYRYSNGVWTKEAELAVPAGIANTHGTYGKSVAVSGNLAIVGNPTGWGNADLSGVAAVFKRTGAAWAEETILTASDGLANDKFGASVAISADVAAIGAPEDDNGGKLDNGGVYYYATAGWVAKPEIKGAVANDQFGFSVSLSGITLLVGAPYNDFVPANAGRIYFYTLSAIPSLDATADGGAANDQFGKGVAIDGNVAIAGSPSDGSKAGS